MEVSWQSSTLWDDVVEQTKVATEKGIDPLPWALQVSSSLSSSGIALPSTELAHVLVNYICWDNNIPTLWKFLDKALMMKIVPPLLVLALLSQRVMPCRRSHPAAYRLYLELLKRHAFTLKCQINGPDYQKVMKSIDATLHLSEIFGLQAMEPGILVVEFIFSIVWQLLDASLDDEGLLELTAERMSRWAIISQEMEIDGHDVYDEKKIEYHERLRNFNTTMAIEIIGRFLQNKITSRILYLARRNMPAHWVGFIQSLRLLGANSAALKNSKALTFEALLELTSDSRVVLSRECKTSSLQKFHAVMAFGSLSSAAGLCHGASRSDLWLPLDLVLEDAMDGYLVNTTSAIEIITGLIKTLQAINGTSWHDTFLGLWIASLRLVQRERDPIEGPVPRLDTRLCMLLSIITLVVAELIEEEEGAPTDEMECGSTNHWKEKKCRRKCRDDLVSSLQVLGDYQGLLAPPQSVVSAANQAAARAMLFVSGINVGSAYFECINMKDMPINCSGNMRHLIVEACIARNLLDTSAYFWPGYVNGRINQLPYSVPAQSPGWSSFMKGAPLTSVMINALVSSPASSLAELEKIFDIAVNGSDDEKISAATILCGASLIRGWNIQEYTVQFITRLMSPPVPSDYAGSDSHLIDYAAMLNVLIVGIASVDCVQIFSLHGLVPQLACSLMPICEVFGSCVPNVSWTLPTGKISPHAVFSNAFALLLKLWRFNHPPIEHGVGDVPTVGSQLTPEYLLLVRNSHLLSSENIHKDRNKRRLSEVASSSSPQPVFLDSFPKLKVWYRQHQRCIAATLSGLVHGTTVHQTVDGLLNMMFRKINRGSQSVTSVTSGSSTSSGPGNEDNSLKPRLPAWDILESVPYVVDAALAACAHGRLSPRELATGLKDLADFLPASLATIVSYFSAEVSRVVWKPVVMNGMDWPSPAANLSNVEEHIKKILAATGVDVPRLATGGSSPATLPLPLAAFVSLTITYKIDKASERFLNLAGPALESLAADCPWPCMPIVASLWTQKAKRWFDFLVFSASRTVFLHNRDAVVQLLKSCFTATLGLNVAPISSNGGVGALLGHGFGSHFCGGLSPVAPGILYLRVYRSMRDIVFITEEVVSLLMHSVREIAYSGLLREKLEKLKTSKNGTKYGQVSLAAGMTRVKLAASLAASLVWLSGGLGLVQSLIKETLPSWFISVHRSQREEGSGLVAMLGGYALAYFTVLCGAFAWGVDSSSSASKRRPKILGTHMEFLASALDGKISLGCDGATWRAYVSGFVSLMVGCTPNWVLEVDVDVLRRLSKGLRQWNEEELALALLGIGGVGTMGAAAELIIEKDF
ncbi:PREDICTED: mediator of RNA polymerase II transcription subunit 33A [Theobroma cacao]|uniref:Mediator of RNA polymerase II transcription subunit 33A n=1 Tax=Theobroma cacao TaxID=3641 RepID=A0AB32V9R0_THECC|nr:PREDICTED: mediator of RNA polymerase II transcription subunit 33A [Theobroma cacao]